MKTPALAQALFSYLIRQFLPEKTFDSFFHIKFRFPKYPCGSGMEDPQLFLHPLFLLVGDPFILIRIPGDLIDADRHGPEVKGDAL